VTSNKTASAGRPPTLTGYPYLSTRWALAWFLHKARCIGQTVSFQRPCMLDLKRRGSISSLQTPGTGVLPLISRLASIDNRLMSGKANFGNCL
jgi:hypothetical protein